MKELLSGSESIPTDNVPDKIEVVIQECHQRDRGAREKPKSAPPAAPESEEHDCAGNQSVGRAIRHHENADETKQRSAEGCCRNDDQQQRQADQELSSSVLPKCLAGDHPGISPKGEHNCEREAP